RSSSATSSARERSDRTCPVQRRDVALPQERRLLPCKAEARQRPRPVALSSKDAAVSVVDVPAIKAGNAELDIVADRRKTLAIFDQVPDRADITTRQRDTCRAVTALDRAVRQGRLVARQPRIVEADDIHVGQVRHMRHLVAEAACNGRANAGMTADR